MFIITIKIFMQIFMPIHDVALMGPEHKDFTYARMHAHKCFGAVFQNSLLALKNYSAHDIN